MLTYVLATLQDIRMSFCELADGLYVRVRGLVATQAKLMKLCERWPEIYLSWTARWFWNVISLRYPLLVHERAYGNYYKSTIAYINDDFYW